MKIDEQKKPMPVMDDVLKRMLLTPPSVHVEKKKADTKKKNPA